MMIDQQNNTYEFGFGLLNRRDDEDFLFGLQIHTH